MKRLIFLKVEDSNPDNKKLKAADSDKAEQKVLAASIKLFKDGIKTNKSIKFVEEIPNTHQVIVEFPEEDYMKVHDTLRSIDVVSIIDPNLPVDETKAKEKIKKEAAVEELSNAEYLKKLKAKMDKYKK